MKGTWTQAATGYDNGEFENSDGDVAIGDIVIAKANGQAFAGYKAYTTAGSGPGSRQALT